MDMVASAARLGTHGGACGMAQREGGRERRDEQQEQHGELCLAHASGTASRPSQAGGGWRGE